MHVLSLVKLKRCQSNSIRFKQDYLLGHWFMDTKYCYICVTHVSIFAISWRHFLTVTQEVDVLKPGVQRLQARIANTILRPNSRHCIVQLSIIHIVQLTCHDLSARNTPCLEAMPVIPSQNVWKIQKCNLFALTKMPTTNTCVEDVYPVDKLALVSWVDHPFQCILKLFDLSLLAWTSRFNIFWCCN